MMYYFLVNPASKSYRGAAIWKVVSDYLSAENIEYHVYYSKRAGYIEELVRDICSEHIDDENPVNIIVLGGDGTLDEALQGIINFEKVNLGYIPTGSSNDFARAMGYDKDPIVNLKRIMSVKEPKRLDLGRLKYIEKTDETSLVASKEVGPTRYFDVSCGIGFDAAICEEAMHSKYKNFLNRIGLGKLIYLLICFKQLLFVKMPSGKLILDGEETVPFKNLRFIVGMNTAYEGGGFKFAPNADPTDGLLDVCSISNIPTLRALMVIPGAIKGAHVKNKKIHMYRVKSYEVVLDTPQWVHTDGEVYTKATHIKVSALPGKLRFLY